MGDPRPEVGGCGEWFDMAAGVDVQGGVRDERGQDPRILALLTGMIGSCSPPITSTSCRMSVRNGRLVQLAAASWPR